MESLLFRGMMAMVVERSMLMIILRKLMTVNDLKGKTRSEIGMSLRRSNDNSGFCESPFACDELYCYNSCSNYRENKESFERININGSF